VRRYGIQSLLVQQLVRDRYLTSYNIDRPPASPASTIKLIVARVLQSEVQQGNLSLNTQVRIRGDLVASGNRNSIGDYISVRQLLINMLRSSSNTAANLLIKRMGGLNRVSLIARRLGYRDTYIRNYISIDKQSTLPNESTVRNTTQAIKDLWLRTDAVSTTAKYALRNADVKFGYPGEIAAKIGNNSEVTGNVGIVRIRGVSYAIGIYINRADGSQSRRVVSAALREIVALVANYRE
jgi:Beta-lactamase enzyme family